MVFCTYEWWLKRYKIIAIYLLIMRSNMHLEYYNVDKMKNNKAPRKIRGMTHTF